jgi:uncharacterized repeat protein (TIGR01451 family)
MVSFYSSSLPKAGSRLFLMALLQLPMLGFWPKAVGAAPAVGAAIENQATGSFLDPEENVVKDIESNTVQVTMMEVAGVTVTPLVTSGSLLSGSIAYFDFLITNVGNDPTQFFIPGQAGVTGGTQGTIQIIEVDPDGAGTGIPITLPSGPVNVPAAGATTGSLLTLPNGSVPSNGSVLPPALPINGTIKVRVPVTITAASGGIVKVVLGDTAPNDNSITTQNQIYSLSTTVGRDLYTQDNANGAVPGEAIGQPANGDSTNHRQEASGMLQITVAAPPPITVAGTVFNDANADVVINAGEAGTNGGSADLTIYGINAAGLVVDKAPVAANGTYSLANIPANSAITLRLSNNSTVALNALAPTTPSRPVNWFHTGENLNGAIDGVIATLGDIALTTATANLANYNFGIRQPYGITVDPAPTVCNVDYRAVLNTGVDGTGAVLPVGANDLNWTAEWIAGPATGISTPYAPPRPVGAMPAVVTGSLAPGYWVNEPTNARWISYPFKLSTNSNGNHNDADLDGIANEGQVVPITGNSDTVRLKFTSTLTLPLGASPNIVSLPITAAADNQFVSIKINGVENLVPTPAANPFSTSFTALQSAILNQGWQPGINTIEVTLDSGPDRVGFLLGVAISSIQLCGNPNVLLVKRITAINGLPQKRNGDSLSGYENSGNVYDDNVIDIPTQATKTDPQRDTDKWPNLPTFMRGAINGGTVKPNDEMDYTIYFISAGDDEAKHVAVCDLIPDKQSFVPTAFNTLTAGPGGITGGDRGIEVSINGVSNAYTNIVDGDIARYYAPGTDLPDACKKLPTDPPPANPNGAIVVELGNIPAAVTPGIPLNSHGFVRFRVRMQ